MKDLIDAVIAFLNAAITAGDIDATIVRKGFDEQEQDQVPIERYPYIMVDDNGERVEADTARAAQTRFYTVSLFIAVIAGDESDSLDAILDLSNQVKLEVEKLSNRQLDGHIWGINVVPYAGLLDNVGFFRGRQIDIEYRDLEFQEYAEY